MFEKLTVFQMSHDMARHAGQRQALVAQNMANADTPGFRPRDLSSFADLARTGGSYAPRATRASHLLGATGGGASVVTVSGTSSSPNGNAVTVEEEMLRAVDVKRQHDRAIAIYRSSLSIIRASIGRK